MLKLSMNFDVLITLLSERVVGTLFVWKVLNVLVKNLLYGKSHVVELD